MLILLQYCLKYQSKLDYIYEHSERDEIRWKLMGYRDRYSEVKIERSKEEIKTPKGELDDETKKFGFFLLFEVYIR